MKISSSLEFKAIVIVVVSILLLFQSCDAQSSSLNHKDSQDEKTVYCHSNSVPCFVPVGYTLRIGWNLGSSGGLHCTSNISNLKWNFTQPNKASQTLTDGTGGVRMRCNGDEHWLMKNDVTLLDSGKYQGSHTEGSDHHFLVEAVAAELQCHLSDDKTQVLIAINHSKIIDISDRDDKVVAEDITNSSCWYKQENSVKQFTRKLYWRAFIFNVEGGAFDSSQLCCQFSVSNKANGESETFSLAPGATIQIGQCNQMTATSTHKPTSSEPAVTASSQVSITPDRIKSSTFPSVALLFLAFSFHQLY